MKNQRQYGLFEKRDGKWVRIHDKLSYPKPQAVRVFQNALLAGAMGEAPERCLKPLPPPKPSENICTRCGEPFSKCGSASACDANLEAKAPVREVSHAEQLNDRFNGEYSTLEELDA